MATAFRLEAREVTEAHTASDVSYLKPGDVVTDTHPAYVQVDRTETTPGKVTLELSEEEAQTLADVLGYIAGPVNNSHRKHVTAITEALSGEGIDYLAFRG